MGLPWLPLGLPWLPLGLPWLPLGRPWLPLGRPWLPLSVVQLIVPFLDPSPFAHISAVLCQNPWGHSLSGGPLLPLGLPWLPLGLPWLPLSRLWLPLGRLWLPSVSSLDATTLLAEDWAQQRVEGPS